MKKIALLTTSLSLIALSSYSYEDYKKQTFTEYNQYEKNIEEEYQAYKKAYLEEFNKFKKEISGVWNEPKMNSKTEWVEYSPDLKSRKSVDFENGSVEIEVILNKNTPQKEVEKKLALELTKTVIESEEQAEKKDILHQRVESSVKKIPSVVVDKPQDKTSIIGSVILNKPQPTVREVVTYTKKTVEKSKIEKKPSKAHNTYVFKIKLDLPRNFPVKKAKKYKNEVYSNSNKYKISPSLIFAIMHSESAFNPRAKSHIPAYGLMQLVPTSGGADAYRYVFNKKKIPSASYLYNPANNANLGTAYLKILDSRYLKGIKNPESRLYCVISAYNTGAGNVFRAFSGSTRKRTEALNKINSMTPSQVYNHLIHNLPYDETKNYLKKVSKRMKLYENANI